MDASPVLSKLISSFLDSNVWCLVNWHIAERKIVRNKPERGFGLQVRDGDFIEFEFKTRHQSYYLFTHFFFKGREIRNVVIYVIPLIFFINGFWIFSKSLRFFGIFLDDFFAGMFMEELFGRIFWEDFF